MRDGEGGPPRERGILDAVGGRSMPSDAVSFEKLSGRQLPILL